MNWTTFALIAGLVLLILIVAYFATNRNSEQDKLTDSQISQAQPEDVEKRCASKATYDLIKSEIFRRAAQLRGSDQAAYDKLSAYASLRVENPVMESEDSKTGAVNCSGSLSLDLPPGVAAVGGRRTLMSDVDYTLQPAADGSGTVVLLRNADSIIAPLATLARVAQPAPAQPAQSNEMAPETNGVAVQPPPGTGTAVPPVQPEPVRPTGARPSFDCAKARTHGEIAVCSDVGLAALDRNMSAQYGRAIAVATPEQRAQLEQSRSRFIAYRDRCANNACIGDAYVGRMREIRDIMEGHWAPPR
jgi:hypothetical protein